MKHEYLRCPVCGKLSKLANFQVHNIGGRHRFPDVMVQEIYSEGRGKIQNEWYSAKLSSETRRELNKVFSAILSQVLDDIEEIVEIDDEDEKIQVEIEKEEEKRKKWGDEEVFEVKDENGEILETGEEISEVKSDDEIVDVGDDEVFQAVDDESLAMEEEEVFRVF
jgi:hypothetical protein